MGIIVVDLFSTLDGVYQAPGGPDEDREGGFEFGGWQGHYFDKEGGDIIVAGIQRLDALLLGRKTYDIFAGFWPNAAADDPIAVKFNAVPKFVASRTLQDPGWAGTTVLQDVAAEVREIRGQYEETHVIGSGDLFQTLLAEGLVDRLNLWLYPVTLGTGKRIFPEGTVPAAFSLAQPPQAFPKGAIWLVYERAGIPVTGVDIEGERGEA
ncbi:dihydrofolate reductase family protein [Arthrobacter sp. NyZ413]|uniref:dihydrofolate reductase family protein n=1 Tax=Arthrobacter sp. NyZ413 TaxID=3144669 RepID=UPI002BE12931|nr:dihydrofolate reductase family protein [Arthrobacter sp.]